MFRRARVEDVAAIVALLADDQLGSGREDASHPINPRYLDGFAAITRDDNQLLAVAERDGVVVGCLQLTFVPGISHLGAWRGLVEGVRVARSQRGGGVGEALMRWAIARCAERGCRMVQLTTNASRTDAQRFYKRLGFVASHVGMKLDI